MVRRLIAITGIVCLFNIFATLLTHMGSGVCFPSVQYKKRRVYASLDIFSDACIGLSHPIIRTPDDMNIIRQTNYKINYRNMITIKNIAKKHPSFDGCIYYTLRTFLGLHPLCGIRVVSVMDCTIRPAFANPRTADSRP